MIAQITFDNILAGFVGAIIGVVASFGINWWNALRTARDALRERLLSLKSYEFATVEKKPDDSRDRYKATYPEILNLTIAYRKLLSAPERQTVTEAFDRYRGIKQKYRNSAKHFHDPPADAGDLETRVDAMLAALGYRGEE